MKQAKVVEEVLLFIEKIMEQEPEVRREIIRLLKKHFDRFKKELYQVLTEGGGSVTDEEQNDSKAAQLNASSRINKKNASSMLALLKTSGKERGNMAVLKEIFDKPLSTRDEDDWW